jgi:DMSO/TMAO reductase YedYZ molybdopterin-dependent catalytic subunit
MRSARAAILRSVQPGDGDEQPPGRPLGRRAFLGFAGVGLTSLAWGGATSDLFAQSTRLLPEPVRALVPFGKGWRIYAVDPPHPTFDPATWRLRIEGMVRRPQTLTYAQLLALPRVSQTSDFVCVTGWSVDDVRWTGVRFADLLAAAGPLPAARALRFESAEEPYVDSLSIEQLAEPDAMLAYGMDDEPLERKHGAPARVVMPKMYGYKGVKWVQRIVVTDRVADGYWQQRGYDRDAWIDDSNGR